MTDRDLLRQALEALEKNQDVLECDQYWPEHQNAIAALRSRLAQPDVPMIRGDLGREGLVDD